ncbi:MAG: flippase [Chloroflexi bacterium]|nr:flippase [Chloroflexota bacterium]
MKINIGRDNLAPEGEAGAIATRLPLALQNTGTVTRRIFKNIGWQYLNTLVTLISGLLMIYILNHYLGIEGYGKYNLVLGFVPTFQILTDWGVTQIALREIAKERSQLTLILGNLFWLRLALSLPALLICWTVALLLNYSGEVLFTIFLFSALLLHGPFEVFSLVFHVDLQSKYVVIPTIICTLLNFGLVSSVVIFNLGMAPIFGAILLTNALRLGSGLILAGKFERPCFKLNFSIWRKLLLMALPLGLTSMVSAIYQQIDVVLLSKLATPYAVGIYSAALRLTNFTTFIPLAIASSLFPLFSNYYTTDQERLRTLYRQALAAMFGLALPLVIGVTLLSDKIIAFGFKPEFAPVSTVLSINIWQSAMLFPGILAGYLLIAAGQQKINLWVQLTSLVIDVALDLLLIPNFSFLGAALANLISTLALTALPLLIAARIISKRD